MSTYATSVCLTIVGIVVFLFGMMAGYTRGWHEGRVIGVSEGVQAAADFGRDDAVPEPPHQGEESR